MHVEVQRLHARKLGRYIRISIHASIGGHNRQALTLVATLGIVTNSSEPRKRPLDDGSGQCPATPDGGRKASLCLRILIIGNARIAPAAPCA